MEQLLKITTIPIEYELNISNAKLEHKNGTAEVEISRDNGGLKIQSRPIKLRLDTFDARNSIVPTTKTSIAQSAQKGQKAAYDATAQFAQEGKLLLQTKMGQGDATLNQILQQRSALPTGDFNIGFVPTTGPDIQWEDSSLTIQYQMDKLNFDFKMDQGDVQFIPGTIELEISQYNDVQIEYMGGPIYVPASAAARFSGEVIDVKA